MLVSSWLKYRLFVTALPNAARGSAQTHPALLRLRRRSRRGRSGSRKQRAGGLSQPLPPPSILPHKYYPINFIVITYSARTEASPIDLLYTSYLRNSKPEPSFALSLHVEACGAAQAPGYRRTARFAFLTNAQRRFCWIKTQPFVRYNSAPSPWASWSLSDFWRERWQLPYSSCRNRFLNEIDNRGPRIPFFLNHGIKKSDWIIPRMRANELHILPRRGSSSGTETQPGRAGSTSSAPSPAPWAPSSHRLRGRTLPSVRRSTRDSPPKQTSCHHQPHPRPPVTVTPWWQLRLVEGGTSAAHGRRELKGGGSCTALALSFKDLAPFAPGRE